MSEAIAERYVRVSEFRSRLGLSTGAAYELIQSRQIESVRIGRSIRIPESAIEEFVERHTVPAMRDE